MPSSRLAPRRYERDSALPYPKEFCADVVNVARGRDPETSLRQIAEGFGIAESCLRNWMRQADVEDGLKPGATAVENSELREAQEADQIQNVVVLGLADFDEPQGGVQTAGAHCPGYQPVAVLLGKTGSALTDTSPRSVGHVRTTTSPSPSRRRRHPSGPVQMRPEPAVLRSARRPAAKPPVRPPRAWTWQTQLREVSTARSPGPGCTARSGGPGRRRRACRSRWCPRTPQGPRSRPRR